MLEVHVKLEKGRKISLRFRVLELVELFSSDDDFAKKQLFGLGVWLWSEIDSEQPWRSIFKPEINVCQIKKKYVSNK